MAAVTENLVPQEPKAISSLVTEAHMVEAGPPVYFHFVHLSLMKGTVPAFEILCSEQLSTVVSIRVFGIQNLAEFFRISLIFQLSFVSSLIG
jgi:hypothetical protein